MASVESGRMLSRAAKVALSANTLVTIDTTTAEGKLVQTGADGLAVGVLLMDVDIDRAGSVVYSGVVKVVAGAALTPGTQVFSDASGRVVGGGGGNRIGVCYTETSGADEVTTIIIQRGDAP